MRYAHLGEESAGIESKARAMGFVIADGVEGFGLLLALSPIVVLKLVQSLRSAWQYRYDDSIAFRVDSFLHQRSRLPQLGTWQRKICDSLSLTDFLRMNNGEKSVLLMFFFVDLLYFTVAWRMRFVGSKRAISKCFGQVASFRLALSVLAIFRRSVFRDEILGVNYISVVKYHRIWGRMVLVYIVIHGVTMTVPHFVTDSFRDILVWSINHHPRTGFLALFITCFIALTSVGRMRRRMYRTFYTCHIAGMLSLITLVYLHTASYSFFPILALSLWVIDRLWRLIGRNEGLLTLEADSDACVWVSMDTAKQIPARLLAPGAFVHMLVPSVHGWKWHPYSIMWSEMDSNIHVLMSKPRSSRNSFASKTARALAIAPSDDTPFGIRVLLQGPYSWSLDFLYAYENIVLIAGGTGISPILALLREMHLTERNRASERQSAKLEVHWAARVRECPPELVERVITVASPVAALTIHSGCGLDSSVSETVARAIDRCPPESFARSVTVSDRRMDCDKVIQQAYSGPTMAVLAYGTTGLLDDVHDACSMTPFPNHFYRGESEL